MAPGILDHQADAMGQLGNRRRGRPSVVDPQTAAEVAINKVWDRAIHAQSERALAAAAWPEHEQRLTPFKSERDVAQCRTDPPGVAKSESLDLDQRVRSGVAVPAQLGNCSARQSG